LLAARRTIWRAATTSVSMSASRNCVAWKSPIACAELAPLAHVVARLLERLLRRADAAGGDIDAPAVEALHGDGKTLPLLAEAIEPRARARCRS
jgi:hypothetical protein